MAVEMNARLDQAKDKIQGALRDLNREVLQEFEDIKQLWPESQPTAPAAAPSLEMTDILAAARRIGEEHTQVDLLKALVETTSTFMPRVLLLIRKSGNAHGWAGSGFTPDFQQNKLKKIKWPIDDYPELARVFHQASPLTANFSDLSDLSDAIQDFDGFVPFKSCFFPLMVKNKVAAILYADSGSEATLTNHETVELLCHVAGLELSLVAAKAKAPRPQPAPEPEPAPEPSFEAPAEPSFEAPASPSFESTAEPSFESSAEPSFEASGHAFEAPAEPDFQAPPEPAFQAPPEPVEEDSPAIKKAKRAARVLVSDLKLYNEAAVNAANGDLYSRLKDDIDRSFQHYKERVSDLSPRPETNYFKEEIIKQLGGGDPAMIGPLPF